MVFWHKDDLKEFCRFQVPDNALESQFPHSATITAKIQFVSFHSEEAPQAQNFPQENERWQL